MVGPNSSRVRKGENRANFHCMVHYKVTKKYLKGILYTIKCIARTFTRLKIYTLNNAYLTPKCLTTLKSIERKAAENKINPMY